MLSGMMAGFLYAMRPENFRATRMRLADRGIFFLPMSPVWPLYCAATIALLGLASWWWDAGGYNRFMTVWILRGQTAPEERRTVPTSR